MTAPTILCPVCQSGPLDPPKACEFCPDSVVEQLDEIVAVIARLAALSEGAPTIGAADPDRTPAKV